MVILTSPLVQILVILTSPPVQILVILTSATGPILVIDFFSQPNSGHIDVFWTTTITRISASEADLKLKKASAEFFTPFSLLRGSISMIYQFFSDYGRVPLRNQCISFCVQILRDFEISNFFVSNLLTLTRPRGAFAPKNYLY